PSKACSASRFHIGVDWPFAEEISVLLGRVEILLGLVRESLPFPLALLPPFQKLRIAFLLGWSAGLGRDHRLGACPNAIILKNAVLARIGKRAEGVSCPAAAGG